MGSRTTLVPVEGYWHAAGDSFEVVPCPRRSACTWGQGKVREMGGRQNVLVSCQTMSWGLLNELDYLATMLRTLEAARKERMT